MLALLEFVQATLTTVAEVQIAAGDDDTVEVNTTTAAKDCVAAAAQSVGVADNYEERCNTAVKQAPQRRTLGNFERQLHS